MPVDGNIQQETSYVITAQGLGIWLPNVKDEGVANVMEDTIPLYATR